MRDRYLKITGHITFLLLLALVLVYAPERTSYVDSAWQFFDRVNYGHFFFVESRYGVFLSEIPLWIAVKCGVPFNALVYIFSASYILLYYGVWWLCVYPLKNAAAGLALLLWLCIGMNFSFMHTVTESQQAMVYSVLAFALLTNVPGLRRRVQLPLLLGVSVLALFCHPFAFFSLAFVAAWPVMKNRDYRNTGSWLIIVLVLLVTIIRFYFFHGPYDAQHYDRLKALPFAEIAAHGSYPLQFYALVFGEQYIVPTLVIITAVIMLLLHKNYRLLFWMLLAVLLYMGVMAIGLHNGDSHIMMERIYLPAFLMIYLVFAEQLTAKEFRFARVMNFLVPLALLGGLYQLNQGGIIFRKRADYLCGLMQQGQQQYGAEQDKFFLPAAQADAAKIQVNWALGTETLVLSQFRFGKSMTLYSADSSSACGGSSYMRSSTMCVPVKDLNKNYFLLADTSGYVPVIKP